MTIRLIRKSDQRLIAARVELAEAFSSRAKGWIGRKQLDREEGLLFPRCKSIHMWFMSVSIDVVFLKRSGSELEIVKLYSSIRPWKLFPAGSIAADDALELPEGSIERSNLRIGEVLCIVS
jgi:uncharacterized membrane protein (UPF0127 family)